MTEVVAAAAIPVVKFLKDWLKELEEKNNYYIVDKHYLQELKRYVKWFESVEERKKMAAEAF